MFYTDFEYGQKTRVQVFVDVFHVLYFSPDPFCVLSLLFCMLGGSRGWGNGASVWVIVFVDRLADCGSRWDTFTRCMVVFVGCRGLSDLFVLLPPSPVFPELSLCIVADWFVEYPVVLWVVL